MTRNSTGAAEQFAALGISPADYTPAMNLAVKQRWSNLPVTEKVDTLRKQVEAVTVEATPSAAQLASRGFADGDLGACGVEAKRLRRNAGVAAWRTRNQLQAALDARELRFAHMRAKRSVA